MAEKKPITKSKLKEINTKNPAELRQSLRESSNLIRLSGGNCLTEQNIESVIHLHCEKGLSLDESVAQVMDEASGGRLSTLRKIAERKLRERDGGKPSEH